MSETPYLLRKADRADEPKIWEILQSGIERRRLDGSEQWQNGYPNPGTVAEDVANGWGFLLEKDGRTVAYAALLADGEPAYEEIEGAWLTAGKYLTVHRVAVAKDAVGQGISKVLMQSVEDYARHEHIPSVRMDTNFDNGPMLHLAEKLGYTRCGSVFVSGAPRIAFEKVILDKETRPEV